MKRELLIPWLEEAFPREADFKRATKVRGIWDLKSAKDRD